MADVQSPIAQPLGGATVSGTQVTVDLLVQSPTVIEQQINNLVAANRGYFADDIFAMPSMSVNGGAIIYTPTFPDDLFLDPNQSLAPRAPGAEAARVASLRRPPAIARPQSLAGSIEVTDEARRRNQVITITSQFQKFANTVADRIQSAAITALTGFITSASRSVSGGNWRAAFTSGVVNADPSTLPQADFGLVMKQFYADKAGVVPDLLLLHQNDAYYLDLIYGDKLPALLDRYGLTMKVSPLVTEGNPIFVKSKQVGVIAFETPFHTELTREGTRFTDVYTMEATPVIVAYDASAVLQLTGINS